MSKPDYEQLYGELMEGYLELVKERNTLRANAARWEAVAPLLPSCLFLPRPEEHRDDGLMYYDGWRPLDVADALIEQLKQEEK